jgi:RimJ/RimL family protein N-acetyltransferase
MFEMASDPVIGTRAGWRPHETVQDSLDFIIESARRPDVYAIIQRSTGRPIGCVELFHDPNIMRKGPKDAEIGYWVGSAYWNQGYATEAVGILLDKAFSSGIPKVWGQCLEDNIASYRVLERCGFRFHHRGICENPVLGEVTVRFYTLSRKERPSS